MKKRYTLRFTPGSVSEVTGNKEELIGELQILIDTIAALDETDEEMFQSVSIYDDNGNDHLNAEIELD